MTRRTILLTAALVATMAANALPAWKGKLTKKQSDGSTVTYFLRGDEWGHCVLTTDGLLLQEDGQGNLRYKAEGGPLAHNPALRTPAERQYVEQHAQALIPARQESEISQSAERRSGSDFQIGTFPTKGDAHALIILADFTDQPMAFEQEYHQRMMNEEGFADYAVEGDIGFVGSARDYFIDQSMGLFQPTFDVVGPVHLSREMAYYGRNDAIYGQDQDAEKMIVEACQLAHRNLAVDFSQYDYDQDGYVDMVFVVFAGYGENAGGGANTVWPKKWNLRKAGYDLTLDGKVVDVFACSSELFGNSGRQTSSIAQFCHEFGHVLGFADHYSTTDSRQYNLGAYDLMDYGAYNNDSRTPPSLNAFERLTLGWLQPEELCEAADGLTLHDINESNRAFRLSTQLNTLEFFLLENRQQRGWDEFLPSSGLMITHVDFDKQLWDSNKANAEAAHPRFCLVCADNEPGYNVLLEKETEEGDLFPHNGNDAFTDSSTPSAKTYTGETLDKWLTQISNEDGVVCFDFMNNHLKRPSLLRERDVDGQQFTAAWTNNDSRSETYNLRLTHMMREQDGLMPVEEDFHLMTAGSNNSGDGTDISSQLDLFMTSKGWTGTNVFQAGGTVQIGKTGTDGQISSPKLNLSTYYRDFALLLKANSMQGKQPALTIEANGLQAKHRLTSTPRMYLYQFSGAGLTATDISISVGKERAFIDSLIIIRGTTASSLYPDAKVVEVTGQVASTADEPFEQLYIPAAQTTVEGIEGCSHTVAGLAEGECYEWEVQAVGQGMTSQWSDGRRLVVSSDYAATGLPAFDAHPSAPTGRTAIYNIKGTRVRDMSQPGVYIVRGDGTARKVVVELGVRR